MTSNPAEQGAPGALEIAEQLMTAYEALDENTLMLLYADDATIWHNIDGPYDPNSGQTPAENIEVNRGLRKILSDVRYEITRRETTETGFVQQHVMHATFKDGQFFAMPACVICQLADGRITRLDEYLDGSIATPVLEQLSE
jgi:ketosteroid isomerase-like protein